MTDVVCSSDIFQFIKLVVGLIESEDSAPNMAVGLDWGGEVFFIKFLKRRESGRLMGGI